MPLRPLTASDILDGAFRVIKRRPAAVLGAAAVVVVPVQVVLALAQHALLPNPFAGWLVWNSVSWMSTSSPSVWALLLYGLGLLLQSLSLFFLGGIVTAFVASWCVGREISVRDALAASFRRTGPFIGAWAILLAAKVVAGMCNVALPFVVPLFVATAPAITAEQLGPWSGVRRSVSLMGRRYWQAVLVVVLGYLVEAAMRTGSLLAGLSALLPEPASWITSAVVNSAFGVVVQTVVVSTSVLLYLDARIRTEGLDLELRAADVLPAGAWT
ncbi:MAG: hypothetical protein WHS89_08875 [Acidimicrobiales bacterium]